jgi:hypothetical protein
VNSGLRAVASQGEFVSLCRHSKPPFAQAETNKSQSAALVVVFKQAVVIFVGAGEISVAKSVLVSAVDGVTDSV